MISPHQESFKAVSFFSSIESFNARGERTYSDGDNHLAIMETDERGDGKAFIDWLTFTFHDSSIRTDNGWGFQPVTDDDVMFLLSERLTQILGFGIFEKRDKGHKFYMSSWTLGENGEFGYLAIGGQRGTVLVDITGKGCQHATPGWESRMLAFLESGHLVNARITRIDLAHDDFSGERYGLDRAVSDYHAGLYQLPRAPQPPAINQVGNWETRDYRGRTLYIGRRQTGKFLRIYEKGKQLGDKASPWVRIELELKAEDRVIPFDALTRPGQYLAGAYPALAFLNETQHRIKTVRSQSKAGMCKLVSWLKHQVAPSLAVAAAVFGTVPLFDQLTEHVTDSQVAKVMSARGLDIPLHFSPHVFSGASGPELASSDQTDSGHHS